MRFLAGQAPGFSKTAGAAAAWRWGGTVYLWLPAARGQVKAGREPSWPLPPALYTHSHPARTPEDCGGRCEWPASGSGPCCSVSCERAPWGASKA